MFLVLLLYSRFQESGSYQQISNSERHDRVRFISGFSDIASPLNRLTQKDMPFVCDENCETDAFQTIKEQLMSSPVLAFPEPDGDYILYTDASGVGVCLGGFFRATNMRYFGTESSSFDLTVI